MLLILFCLLGILVALSLIGFVYFKETHLPPIGEYDAILVLGAQVKPDGSPSVALERRMTAALESYRARPALIIACGGQGANEPAAEGDVMRSWFIAHGAAESDVIAETASTNTRQNVRFAREIMESRGLAQALVVTSDYHVARALAICRQEGIPATGKGSPSKPEYFVKNHIQEGVSWMKFFVESLR